jgi:hypothetical protein
MTVYAADWRQHERCGRITARWSHLTAGPGGDLRELHDFAARIVLRRSRSRDKPWPRAHCAVTDSKRQQAIATGTVLATWQEAARQHSQAANTARQAGAGGGAQ